jgi:hypothetical protein
MALRPGLAAGLPLSTDCGGKSVDRLSKADVNGSIKYILLFFGFVKSGEYRIGVCWSAS